MLIDIFTVSIFFCLHSNLPIKPRSQALKSKEYVIQNEAWRTILNTDKAIFKSWKRSIATTDSILPRFLGPYKQNPGFEFDKKKHNSIIENQNDMCSGARKENPYSNTIIIINNHVSRFKTSAEPCTIKTIDHSGMAQELGQVSIFLGDAV